MKSGEHASFDLVPGPLDLTRQLVAELIQDGAEAVVLTGSHARGTATDASDLDFVVIGDGPSYLLDVREGVLVAQAWANVDEHRRRLSEPGEVGTAVPGWREAVLLHDPDAVAATLKQEALDWSWEQVEDHCDRWVAEKLIGYAEEVQKLVAAMRDERKLIAAVQRDLLAVRLAPILAVHQRLLYGTENVLWDRVGDAMGLEWRQEQAAALATGGESFEQSCIAALCLFRLAVAAVQPLLDDRQLAVTRRALALARNLD